MKSHRGTTKFPSPRLLSVLCPMASICRLHGALGIPIYIADTRRHEGFSFCPEKDAVGPSGWTQGDDKVSQLFSARIRRQRLIRNRDQSDGALVDRAAGRIAIITAEDPLDVTLRRIHLINAAPEKVEDRIAGHHRPDTSR